MKVLAAAELMEKWLPLCYCCYRCCRRSEREKERIAYINIIHNCAAAGTTIEQSAHAVGCRVQKFCSSRLDSACAHRFA